MPGWYNAVAPSFAYHGDDGHLFGNSNNSEIAYAGPYGKGDTIGCEVIYNDSVEGTIFYTRNGEPQGMMTLQFALLFTLAQGSQLSRTCIREKRQRSSISRNWHGTAYSHHSQFWK